MSDTFYALRIPVEQSHVLRVSHPMPICSSCGATNREDARFCYQCAARITREHPSPADHAWLAATLTTKLASPSEAPTQPQRSISTAKAAGTNQAEAPLIEDQGAPMDQ